MTKREEINNQFAGLLALQLNYRLEDRLWRHIWRQLGYRLKDKLTRKIRGYLDDKKLYVIMGLDR